MRARPDDRTLLVAAPSPALAPFVEFLWLEVGAAPPGHTYERVLPTGTVELVLDVADRPLRLLVDDGSLLASHAAICGTTDHHIVIEAERAAVIGAHLRPGGALAVLGVTAGDLTNRREPLDRLWGNAATALRDRVASRRTPRQRLAELDAALCARVVAASAIHPAVARALARIAATAGALRLGELAAEIGMQQKRLIALFHEQVGLTPKRYARVLRFQQVVATLEASPGIAWSDVALAAGYYDQAHFIHEFRAFTGLAPSAFAALGGALRNHVVV